MQTQEKPQKDPTQTYSQTDAARMCGVSQAALRDRDGKTGYLSKLNYCFPGKYWKTVATAELAEPDKVRLLENGVQELKALIQGISPEPPLLESGEPVRGPDGRVIKNRKLPECTLLQYAEFVWFRRDIDGAAEHELLKACKPSVKLIEAAIAEEEEIGQGTLITIDHTESPILATIDRLEGMNSMFWEEVQRRAQIGYQQGVFLKSVELEARTKGEITTEQVYYDNSKNVGTRKAG